MGVDKRKTLREEAWVGDAVLSLRARQWLLDSPWREHPRRDALFQDMTNNQYLSGLGLGDPTSVEARIGQIYMSEGLEAAFAWIDAEVLPNFLNRLRRASRP